MKWTFFAGLGLGAAVGMLVAPSSGAETREGIEEFARNSLTREKLNEVLEQGREQLNSVRDRVQPVMDQARDKVSGVTGRVVERAANMKDRVLNGGLLTILNEWPHERLIEIDGIGPVLATKIIQGRPYESSEALLEAKLPPSAIASLKKAA